MADPSQPSSWSAAVHVDDPVKILVGGMTSAHLGATAGLNRLAVGLPDIPPPQAPHSSDQDAIDAAEPFENAARKLRSSVAVQQHFENQA